jgi:thioredoxin
MLEHLTKERFLEKVFNYEKNKEWKFEGDLPCVIDFYADRCPPCRIVAPIMEELSDEYKGRVSFFKIDTDAEWELAITFGIKSIPSILFCPLDEKPRMSIGALPKDKLKKLVDEQLLGKRKNVQRSDSMA